MFRTAFPKRALRWRTLAARCELLFVLMLVAVMAMPAQDSFAGTSATFVWTGSGPDPRWSTGLNWNGGNPPSAGSSLQFPSGASQLTSVNDLLAGTSFQSLNINAPNYTISGNDVILTGNLQASFNGTATIHNNIGFGTMGNFQVVN
jgi:hypothetical protein